MPTLNPYSGFASAMRTDSLPPCDGVTYSIRYAIVIYDNNDERCDCFIDEHEFHEQPALNTAMRVLR